MKMKTIRRAPAPRPLPPPRVSDADNPAACSLGARLLRRCQLLLEREEAQNLVEFAFVAPLLLLAVTGVLWFGIALNDYQVLTNAANAGARAFALVRGLGQTDPCNYTISIIQGSASTLNSSTMTMSWTYTPSGGSPTTYKYPTTCSGIAMNSGDTVRVTLTYPVTTVIAGWNNNKLTLTAQTTELVQ